MNPTEKLKELRGETSRPKFAQKLGVEIYVIKNVEEGKQKTIPDNLALALEREYGILFKWWKTGEGEMFINPEEADPSREIKEMLDELDIPPEIMKQVLQATSKEPELMSFAAKAIQNRDQTALERLYKLLKEN